MRFHTIFWLLSISLIVAIANASQDDTRGSVGQKRLDQKIEFDGNNLDLERRLEMQSLNSRQRTGLGTGIHNEAKRQVSSTAQGEVSLPDHWRKLAEDLYLRPVNTSRLDRLEAQLRDHLRVRVAAVAENIKVLVDGQTIYSTGGETSSGFHVLALDPLDGRLLLKRHFKTGGLGDGVLMRSCLASLQPGTLVVLIPMFNAGGQLGTTEKFLLEKLGMEGYGVGGAVKSGPASYIEAPGGFLKSGPTSYIVKLRGVKKPGAPSYQKRINREANTNSSQELEDNARAARSGNNLHPGKMGKTVKSNPRDRKLAPASSVDGIRKSTNTDSNLYLKENVMTTNFNIVSKLNNATSAVNEDLRQNWKNNYVGEEDQKHQPHKENLNNMSIHALNSSDLLVLANRTTSINEEPSSVKVDYSKYSNIWRGYIYSEDPCVIISQVPQGWPPEKQDVSLRGKVYAESAIIFIGNRLKTSNLDMATLIPRHQGQHCPWHDEPARAAQLRFCSLYEGYGALCRCQDPIIPERLRRAAPPIAMTENIPVAMLTAKKSFFFYRQLVNLLTTPGAAQTSILVLIDGYHKETVQLAELFGLPVVVHTHEGITGTSTPLNAHFRFSVHRVFSMFRNCSKAIILEDDLLLSPDFLSYFQQTAWLLDADPSLYCVNSFSLHSCASTASDVGRLKRSELFPQFGWMVTRTWAEELLHLWISNRGPNADWDWWLHNEDRRKKRHAIVPEVSRSFHSGAAGAHVSGLMQAMIFSNMIYNQDPHVKLNDLDTLLEQNYEAYILNELQTAIRLPGIFNPCLLNTLPADLPSGHVLMAVRVHEMGDKDDSLKTVARCLHAFPQHAYDQYKGVLQFTLTKVTPQRRLYVLGCPLSPYCDSMSNLTLLEPPAVMKKQVRTADDGWRFKAALAEARQLHLFNHSALVY